MALFADEAPANAKPKPFSVARFYAPRDVEIWPENWATFTAYRRVCDQWIVGPGGLIGLNNAAVYPLLERSFEEPADWLRALDDIRAMADAVADDLRARQG